MNPVQNAEQSETDVDVQAEEQEGPVASTTLFRLGRLLFGGVLTFTAIDNLRTLDGRVQYAEAKGAPAPEKTVPGLSAGLLLGGIGVALWRLPSLAAAAVASFFVSVTPVMHDFWAVEDDEEQQQQLIQFLKNTALLGAALAFLKLGRRSS